MLPLWGYARELADSNCRLQAEMVLVEEVCQFATVLKGESVVTALHNDVVLLGDDDGSSIILVKGERIVLAEMLLQEFLFCVSSHNFCPPY